MARVIYDKRKFIPNNKKSRYSKTKIYRTYGDMKQRCLCKTHSEYKNYGGRGITICERWMASFDNFYDDMFDSMKDGLSLDKIDNDGMYCKENCRWTIKSVQNTNRRRPDGMFLRGTKKHGERYSSSIKIFNKFYHIGMFNTEIEAHGEYVKIHKEWFGF